MIKQGSRIIMLWLFLFTLSVYCLIASGHYGGDAVNSYLTTESIVLRGDLAIRPEGFEISEVRSDKADIKLGRDGKAYSPQGLGMPLLQIPAYVLGLLISSVFGALPRAYTTFFCVSFTNSFLSAANCVLLFCIMSVLGFDRVRAAALSLIYAFSTMAFVYSKTGFSEPAQVAFMLIAILALFSYFKVSKKASYLVISGLALGYMGLIKESAFMLCPLFAVYFFVKNENGKVTDILPAAISYAAIACVALAFNYIRFGDILATGYGNAAAVGLESGNHFFKGLYYYWLSSNKGFFFYNVPLVIALFCWRSFYSKNKKEFFFIVAIIALYVLYFANFFKRGSLFSWGPRYLFPIIPLFILLMENALEKRPLAGLLIMLSAVGFFVQLPALIVNYSKYLYFAVEKLHVQEYLINFIPDLNHIKGAWELMAAVIQKAVFGSDRIFCYSPDPVFIKAVSAAMSEYSVVDLWYVNLAKFSPALIGWIYFKVFVILALAFISGGALFRKIK